MEFRPNVGAHPLSTGSPAAHVVQASQHAVSSLHYSAMVGGRPQLKIISTSWKSIVEQERQDRSYSVFVRALHQRISESASAARFERGTSPWIYWPGFAIFVAVAVGVAGGAVQALQAGAYVGAAFARAFLALYLWQIENFLRRNRPGTYSPEALPRDVMPP